VARPDRASGPIVASASSRSSQPESLLRSQEGSVDRSVSIGTGSGRACEAPGCGRELTARRRRFCTDECRRRGQKAERVIEDDSYAAGVVRLIGKLGVRASADVEALKWLAGAVEHARGALAMAVDGCRARGYSDGEIGAALGVSPGGLEAVSPPTKG
jgi:hypothetical protein